MSNGYLVAAAADLAAAHEIADGFGLDVIDASSVHDRQTTGAALARAANVGVIISNGAARDEAFVALLSALATQRQQAQLILVTGDARAAFPSLPAAWPAMALEEARSRSNELLRRKQAEAPPADDATRAQPLPPAEAPPPAAAEPAPDANAPSESTPVAERDYYDILGVPRDADAEALKSAYRERATAVHPDRHPGDSAAEANFRELSEAYAVLVDPETRARYDRFGRAAFPKRSAPAVDEFSDSFGDHRDVVAPPAGASAPTLPPAQAAPTDDTPDSKFEADSVLADILAYEGGSTIQLAAAQSAPPPGSIAPTAPADATAFAPGKLRRGTPELVRIVVHQPKDLNAVIKAARKLDPTTEPAPQGMGIGDVAIGAKIGVSLEVRGGACEGTLQRRTWLGEPVDFNFAVEADASVKQAVMLARVFINDAQIGVLAFTRNVSGPAKKPHNPGDRARLKRHKRVFLSYSAKDREVVSAIATAYQMAGVEHFWDRASLKSGEEWHPRLRREIDRADLFHLCWSKAAAQSEWVAKEAEHALTRRRRNSGKPEITVQMLDGPPWAPHPPSLDTINFDDFVRAAIVGYARGDGS